MQGIVAADTQPPCWGRSVRSMESQLPPSTPPRERSRRRLILHGATLLALIVLVIGLPPLSRSWLHDRARRAIRNRHPEAALASLTTLDWIGLANGETEFLLARTHRHLGDFDRVRKHIQRARDQDVPVSRLEREQWLTLAQAGQLAEVEPHLQELLIHAGEDGPEILYSFVHGYLINLRFAAAEQLIRVWQQDFPDDPGHYFLSGYMARLQYDYPTALDRYEQGLALAPHRPEARLHKAQLLLNMNRVEQAREEFGKLAAAMPDDHEVALGLASCLIQSGHAEKAKPILERIAGLADHADHFDIRAQLGSIAVAEKDFESAVRWLEPLCEERPYETGPLTLLSQAYRLTGREQAAREMVEKISLATEKKTRLGKLTEECLAKPFDTDLRMEIAVLLDESGLKDESARWLRAIVQIDAQHARAHERLARYYESLEDFKRASLHRQLARDDVPDRVDN